MSTKVAKFLSTLELQDTKLAHWGIKGMRWGIRRSDDELARLSGDASDAARAEATQKAIRKSGSLSVASDADLNHLVNRINLETRYAAANASPASKVHPAIKSLLGVGDTMNKAYTFSQSPAGKILSVALGFEKIAPGTGKHRKL